MLSLLIDGNFAKSGEYKIRVVAGKFSAFDEKKQLADIQGATDIISINVLPKKDQEDTKWIKEGKCPGGGLKKDGGCCRCNKCIDKEDTCQRCGKGSYLHALCYGCAKELGICVHCQRKTDSVKDDDKKWIKEGKCKGDHIFGSGHDQKPAKCVRCVELSYAGGWGPTPALCSACGKELGICRYCHRKLE